MEIAIRPGTCGCEFIFEIFASCGQLFGHLTPYTGQVQEDLVRRLVCLMGAEEDRADDAMSTEEVEGSADDAEDEEEED